MSFSGGSTVKGMAVSNLLNTRITAALVIVKTIFVANDVSFFFCVLMLILSLVEMSLKQSDMFLRWYV